MDDIKASFRKYDVDKSGSITLDEAYLVLQVNKHRLLSNLEMKYGPTTLALQRYYI